MRDDIHKNAPVPRRWKTFIRTCTNPSESLSECRRRLFEAMKADAASLRDAMPAIKKGLSEEAAHLPGFGDVDALRSIPRAGDGMAVNIAVENTIRLTEAFGASAVDTTEVVRLTLEEVMDRRFRQIENYLCQENEKYRPKLMARMRSSERGLDRDGIVRSTEDGTLSARPSPKPTLDLDASLL